MNYRLFRIATICIVLIVPYLVGLSSSNIDLDRSICPVMRWLEIPCPGCGLTKAIYYAWCGEFTKSIEYHPLGLTIIAIGVVLIAMSIIDMIRGTHHAERLLDTTLLWQVVAILFAGYYIVRLCL